MVRHFRAATFAFCLAAIMAFGTKARADDGGGEMLRWYMENLAHPLTEYSGTFTRWECESRNNPSQKRESLRLSQLIQASARSEGTLAFPGEWLQFEAVHAKRADGECFRFLKSGGLYNQSPSWFVQGENAVLVERQTKHLREFKSPDEGRNLIALERIGHLLDARLLAEGLPNVETLGDPVGELRSPILDLPMRPVRLKPGLPEAPSSRQWMALDATVPSRGIEIVQIVGLPNGTCAVNVLAYHRWLEVRPGVHRPGEFSQLGLIKQGTVADLTADLLALDSGIEAANAVHMRWVASAPGEGTRDTVLHPQPFEDFMSYSTASNPQGYSLSERDRGRSLYDFEDLPFHSTETVKSMPATHASAKEDRPSPTPSPRWSRGHLAAVLAGLAGLAAIVAFLMRRRRMPSVAALIAWAVTGAAPAHSDPCGAEWRLNVSDIEAGTARVELPDWASGPLPNTFAVLVTNDTPGAVEYARIRPACWCIYLFSDRLTLVQGESIALEFNVVAPADVPFGAAWERAMHFWKAGDPPDLPPRQSLTLAGRLLERPILSFQLHNRVRDDWRGTGIPATIANQHTKLSATLESAEFAGSPCDILLAEPKPGTRMLGSTFPVQVPPEANLHALIRVPEDLPSPEGMLVLKWRTQNESWEDRIFLHRSMTGSHEFNHEVVELHENETSGTARIRITRHDGSEFSVSPTIAAQAPFVVTFLSQPGVPHAAIEMRVDWLASEMAAKWGMDRPTRRSLIPYSIEVSVPGTPCGGITRPPSITVAIPAK